LSDGILGLASLLERAKEAQRRRIGPFALAPWCLTNFELQERFRYISRLGKQLLPYQARGVHYLQQAARRLIFDDVGLGKTVQAVSAFPMPHKARIVCVVPKSVQHSWADHIKDWFPHWRVHFLEKPGDFRFPQPGEVVLSRWTTLPSEENMRIMYRRGAPLLTVYDEGQRGKTPGRKRTDKALRLSALSSGVWVLTASPLYNKVKDLWNVCNLAGYASLLGSQDQFQSFFKKNYDGDAIEAYPELAELLRIISMRRTQEEVLDLPPLQYHKIAVHLDDRSIRAQCDAIMRDLGGENGLIDALFRAQGAAIHARRHGQSRAAMRGQLMRARKDLALAKYPFVLDKIREFERSGNPVAVFSCHRGVIDKLEGRDRWSAIHGDVTTYQRRVRQQSFQNGRGFRGMAFTTAANEGIDLFAARSLLRVDLHWVPSVNDQAAGRIQRMGAVGSGHVFDFVADCELDERCYDILTPKHSVRQSLGLRSQDGHSRPQKRFRYRA